MLDPSKGSILLHLYHQEKQRNKACHSVKLSESERIFFSKNERYKIHFKRDGESAQFTLQITGTSLLTILNILHINIQNHPSVLILSAVHHEVFTAGALKARVHRTSALRAPAGKNRVMYFGFNQHTRVVLYLIYTQPEISFNCCIIA